MASWMSKRFGVALAIGLGIGAATAALAHDDTRPKGQLRPAVKAAYDRHDNFQKLGGAFKKLNDELKKDSPDVATIQAQTRAMVTLANGLPTWFPKGSGVDARPKAETKPNIWTDAAGFQAASSAMQVQVSKLNQAALSGNIAAIKAQVRPTGGSCKGCHDKFREEKK